MQRFIVRRCGLLTAAILILPGRACFAADGGAASYVGADVVDVGMIDLTKIDAAGTIEQAISFGLVPAPQVTEAREQAAVAQEALGELPRLGVRRVYALFRTSDLQAGGPAWVIETDSVAAAARVVEWLKPALEAARRKDNASGVSQAAIQAAPKLLLVEALHGIDEILPTQLEVAGSEVLCTRTADQLAALKAAHSGPPRADAQAALELLAKADAGVVAIGDADTRRVIREMFPALPAPFAEIDGRLLADGVAWAAVTLKLPPNPTISLAIEGATSDAAKTLEQSTTKGLEALKGLCLAATVGGSPEAASVLPVLALLKPQVDGTRLSLTFGDDKAEVDAIHTLLLPAVAGARESASRVRRMNNLKQLALAMFMYNDANKSFPPAAISSADGKPLLSWRVAMLPYLGQEALYKEFRLDEPWDSEHNRKLIDRMPEVYASTRMLAPTSVGQTTLVVPTGETTVFHDAHGTRLSDIKDGTSTTILIVDAAPERAVVWTKPEDWEVDFKDPLRGVKREASAPDHGGFAAAFCDGHVQWIADSFDPKDVAAMLTRDGKEIVDR